MFRIKRIYMHCRIVDSIKYMNVFAIQFWVATHHWNNKGLYQSIKSIIIILSLSEECTNHRVQCGSRPSSMCESSGYGQWMQEYCPLKCGLCGKTYHLRVYGTRAPPRNNGNGENFGYLYPSMLPLYSPRNLRLIVNKIRC